MRGVVCEYGMDVYMLALRASPKVRPPEFKWARCHPYASWEVSDRGVLG